jgi:transcriptional regulator with XRE-family HTH domain
MIKNNYILNFRKRFGWSQRKLSEQSGISISAIKSWESGKTNPPKWIELVFSAILYELQPYKQYNKNSNNDNK